MSTGWMAEVRGKAAGFKPARLRKGSVRTSRAAAHHRHDHLLPARGPVVARIVSRCHDLLVMTKAEYAAQAAAQDDWAPGWLAIDASFESVYPGITPRHLGSPLHARAILCGEEYLDGISLFPSPNGYQHLLTCGMYPHSVTNLERTNSYI